MARTKNHGSITADLTERLRLRVHASGLGEGAFFMTEAQLATEYQVSRTVAREAIGRLRAMGIVESRQRKGLVIGRPDPLQIFADSFPAIAKSSEDLAELGLLRYLVEVGATELAIRYGTNEQIEELGQATANLESAARNHDGWQSMMKLEVEFHSKIFQMTGSRLISGMQQMLVCFFNVKGYVEPDQAKIERIVWEHRELYAAIRDRDVERARSLVRSKLRFLLPVKQTPTRSKDDD